MNELLRRFASTAPKQLAVIDESRCIGCTLCIQACPVDAILGAAKQMHTVIACECIGCELCIAPCPVDCIDMGPAIPQSDAPRQSQSLYGHNRPYVAQARYQFRLQRLALELEERTRRQQQKMISKTAQEPRPETDPTVRDMLMKAEIAAAIERARAKRAPLTPRK